MKKTGAVQNELEGEKWSRIEGFLLLTLRTDECLVSRSVQIAVLKFITGLHQSRGLKWLYSFHIIKTEMKGEAQQHLHHYYRIQETKTNKQGKRQRDEWKRELKRQSEREGMSVKTTKTRWRDRGGAQIQRSHARTDEQEKQRQRDERPSLVSDYRSHWFKWLWHVPWPSN